MKPNRTQVKELCDQVEAAHAFAQQEQWAQARDGFRAVIERAQSLGIDSPFVYIRLALVLLEMGEVEDAFRAISTAVRLDPIHPQVSAPFLSAVSAMRDELERRCRNGKDEAPPRIYSALARAGETDARCHMALARYWMVSGDLEEASRLLNATTLLEPSRAEAWKLLAEVARRSGDEAKARELELRAQAVEEAATPFGIPAPTATC